MKKNLIDKNTLHEQQENTVHVMATTSAAAASVMCVHVSVN